MSAPLPSRAVTATIALLTTVAACGGPSAGTQARDHLDEACTQVSRLTMARIDGNSDTALAHFMLAKDEASQAATLAPDWDLPRELYDALTDPYINDDFRVQVALDICVEYDEKV